VHEGVVRAPVVIAADGPGSIIAKRLGVERRPSRPMAVGVRTYYRSRRWDDEWISSFLNLTDADGGLLSGYGWIFPLDDGTLNVGLGLLSTSREFQGTNYRRMLKLPGPATTRCRRSGTPPRRTISVRCSPARSRWASTGYRCTSAACCSSVTAGGMVNPFNGEGISYAMEAGQLAAEVIDRALTTAAPRTSMRSTRSCASAGAGTTSSARCSRSWSATRRSCTSARVRHAVPAADGARAEADGHLTDTSPADAKDVLLNTLQRMAPAA
jgi:menaquinone-9 beta-reductase